MLSLQNFLLPFLPQRELRPWLAGVGRREPYAVLALSKGHGSSCCPTSWPHPLGSLALDELCSSLLDSNCPRWPRP